MTELDKLKNTASVIRDLTEGRIQMRPSGMGHICIHATDDAYITLKMDTRSLLEQECYDVSFSSYVRRMGSDMSSRDLSALAREVHQVQALLTALELTKLRPTLDDLQAFHDHLLQQEHVQTSMDAQSM